MLGELDRRGDAIVIPALDAMLASGAPLQLTRLATAVPPPTVPTALAAIEVPSGCAADYDTWLREVPA